MTKYKLLHFYCLQCINFKDRLFNFSLTHGTYSQVLVSDSVHLLIMEWLVSVKCLKLTIHLARHSSKVNSRQKQWS